MPKDIHRTTDCTVSFRRCHILLFAFSISVLAWYLIRFSFHDRKPLPIDMYSDSMSITRHLNISDSCHHERSYGGSMKKTITQYGIYYIFLRIIRFKLRLTGSGSPGVWMSPPSLKTTLLSWAVIFPTPSETHSAANNTDV
jgi:hypothetical protein